MKSFWDGKEPCWILMGCSGHVVRKCPAFHFQERPCWEIPYTQCELLISIKKECRHCKVYKLYGMLGESLFP